MAAAFYTHALPSVERRQSHLSSSPASNVNPQPGNAIALAQGDGGADHHFRPQHITTRDAHAQHSAQHYIHQQPHVQAPHQTRNTPSMPPPPLRQQAQVTGNAVRDLLPYCTTEPPLDEAQVIALSDVVGSLRELVLLALAAASGDVSSIDKLEGALGERAAANIFEFFVDEWEIEG